METTPAYWDCECKVSFIHDSREHFCPECGATKSTQPDSRVDEINKVLPRTFSIDHENSNNEILLIDLPRHEVEVHIKTSYKGVYVEMVDAEGGIIHHFSSQADADIKCSVCEKKTRAFDSVFYHGRYYCDGCWDERMKE
ncbi:MAG: hypothetical protein SVK08_02050 [Halobacteriota archaeon]|nr:hypothetical protein [Halobacteriota archaeon]